MLPIGIINAVLFLLAVGGAAQQPPVEIARRALDLLLEDKYAEVLGMSSTELRAVASEERLRSSLQPYVHAAGAVQKRLEPKVQTVRGNTVFVFPVEFQRASLEFVISVNPAGEIAGLFVRPAAAVSVPWSPPAYSKPDSFRSEEVTIGKGEWALPGSLTLPVGKGKFAGLVLVHGSGANDRDESYGPNKAFRDLAEGLGSRGIAVLRYEKRTRQFAGHLNVKELTVQQETVDDALAAAEFLRARPEIDPARVVLLGHSLGGYLLPRIGRRDPKLGGLVSLAGSTRPLEDMLVDQYSYLASLGGNTPEAMKGVEKAKAEAQRVKALTAESQVPASELPLGVPPAYWLDLQGYDPPAEARKLKQPMLILQGERDYQSTMVDFARWREALKNCPNATLRSFPTLNHMFYAGEGKCTPEEYFKPGHVAPEVIDEIVTWINKISR